MAVNSAQAVTPALENPLLDQLTGVLDVKMLKDISFAEGTHVSQDVTTSSSFRPGFSCHFVRNYDSQSAVTYRPGTKTLRLNMDRADTTSNKLRLETGVTLSMASYYIPVENSKNLRALECRELHSSPEPVQSSQRLGRVSALREFLDIDAFDYDLNKKSLLGVIPVVTEDLE